MNKQPPLDLNKIYKDSEYIIGMDEAAWGSISDNFVVAACIFPRSQIFPSFIRDSKKLTEKQRLKAFDWIMENATFHYHESIEPIHFIKGAATVRDNSMASVLHYVDVLGILLSNSVVIVDGLYVPKQAKIITPLIVLPKADMHIPAVSAASIIAKVTHDNSINEWHKIYPEYDWLSNKGYSTPNHVKALNKYGACERHRFNIKMIQNAKVRKF